MVEASSREDIVPLSSDLGCQYQKAGSKQSKMPKLPHLQSGTPSNEKLQVLDEIVPASGEVIIVPIRPETQEKSKLHSASCSSRSLWGCSSRQTIGVEDQLACSSGDLDCQTRNCALAKGCAEKGGVSSTSNNATTSMEVNSKPVASTPSKPILSSVCYKKTITILKKAGERSWSRGKGDISKSSRSSTGHYIITPSFSRESQHSLDSRSVRRPHMSKYVRWEAINSVKTEHCDLSLRHFKLLRKLGSGDIGTVYLSELIGTNCLFAVKVMDNDFLASRRKMSRALVEKEILDILDHPFLPTLYAYFKTDKFFCLVMDYCPGGDLHALRQKQPNKCFTEQAARFYAAEVLLALEYLHMLGVVYRDLKPENVLVREDGHIMLTDFDLSLRCAVDPTILKSSSPVVDHQKKMSGPCLESSCIGPSCLGPSWQASCFTPRFLSAAAKSHSLKSDLASQASPLPQLVVEPTNARSNSFVGTYEYLAPEIIKGEGHGSAVDWWTLGIFLYELLYGMTPFKGLEHADTLVNIVSQSLKFPETPKVSSSAIDLIRILLKRASQNRLGSERGAAEIKQHPFFEGLNLALIRCVTPPELPDLCDIGNKLLSTVSKKGKTDISQKGLESTEDDIVFEMF